MEELFEVVIAIATIAFAVFRVAGNAKKVKKNAPGQAEKPAQQTAPVKPAPMRPAVRPTVAPTIHPEQPTRTVQPTVHIPQAQPARAEVQTPGGAQQTFWQQVGDVLREMNQEEAPARGHEAAGKMAEGDSRECEHGSVGGSMAYESHQGGSVTKDRPLRRSEEAQETSVSPALTAEEMRRAVVMAEVLKRPQERMAEQARRWAAR